MQQCSGMRLLFFVLIPMLLLPARSVVAQNKPRTGERSRAGFVRDGDLPYPPTLPDGQRLVSDTSVAFLKPPDSLKAGVLVAQTPPRIDFLFYPQQTYPGKPWSNWGDGSFANGKYYSAIGDHYAIGRGESRHGTGTALLYEFDPQTAQLRTLTNVSKFLNLPAGHYAPGKIHSRVDMGSDGWLYYATHRGSPRAAIDANHYTGDWILRTNPKSGKTEIVAQGPVPRHSIPNSVLDPERMIFYGATAPGPDSPIQEIQFFAWDVKNGRLLYSGTNGPARYMILARSSGRLYYVPGNSDGELMRYDPSANKPPVPTGRTLGVRAATRESSEGTVYTVSSGQRSGDAALWQFNTRTEEVKRIGTAAVGQQAYVASLDLDPTGRFLYYVPGAHGGGYLDGSPLVQFNLETGSKKVIAFLHPAYQDKYGFTPKGTYSTAVSSTGDSVFITWNISRGTRAWDCCGLSVVHIPESER